MTTLIRILAQHLVKEKHAGWVEFNVEIDSDLCELEWKRSVNAFKILLAKHNTEVDKYVFMSAAPELKKPITLCSSKEFERVILEEYEKEPKDDAEERALNEDVDFLLDK